MRGKLFVISAACLAASLHSAPGALARPAQSVQSKTCAVKADKQGLTDGQRDTFVATCAKGSLTPKHATTSRTNAPPVQAVVAPSGSDRTSRSTACNTEAAKRGLADSAFQSFRKGCLASAAPVHAIETAQTPTKPTNAKPKLEGLTNTPPH